MHGRARRLSSGGIVALCLLLSQLLSACALPWQHGTHGTPNNRVTTTAEASPPLVDPQYIYSQLAAMAPRFLHREAGYDNNLPPNVNGHDEFAAYWAEEMQRDLQGFGAQVRKDAFPIAGWRGRPAVVPAVNVEVSVPGETHPEQVVVIGCHYDGEASSTQSANDDASGCAIELGVARAMAQFWRTNHLYPARTLRFVLFDAEEQGLFGSFDYLNNTINGDLRNIVAMVNEEQSGIAYPLRYLGRAANPLLPFYAELTAPSGQEPWESGPGGFVPQIPASPVQRAAIARFQTLARQAVPAVFLRFRAAGDGTLSYTANDGKPQSQPIFTPAQQSYIHVENDRVGSSDQVPFELADLPAATFVGNSTYYDRQPPPWSYPFDQPQDTLALMNIFASGSPSEARALTLALALPAMYTTELLRLPDVLGAQPGDGRPIAAISDIGVAQPGRPLTLDASASYDPKAGAALSYSWSFGDGAQASGIRVSHTYAVAGTYHLSLTVTSPSGKREVTKTITVSAQPATFANPYAAFPQDGTPPANPSVRLPAPVSGQGG